ncbi:MAG TPA: SDR family NAD(P)-dependent oxidoreductase [Myxococcota bacterium]|jgi:NAD(P)-dependent dehydrogenase (short-subunit alcohol dehydrogenase family)
MARSFDMKSTTDQVLEGIDLTGKLALVTGASSGLGVETTRALAAKGARVVMAARDVAKIEQHAAAIRAKHPGAQLEVMELHLDEPASVRAFAKAFLAKHPKLNLLIGNAGVMACPLMRTAEGWEMQFATNHLGHFLLANSLTSALVAGAPARVISVSSAGHQFSPVVFDDIQFERRAYDKWASYGQAKTANILFAVELDRRLSGKGVRAFANHPGGIVTELGRHLTPEDIKFIQDRAAQRTTTTGGMTWKTPEQGAATQVWGATAPELAGKGGLYLEDVQISGVAPPKGSAGCAAYALDAENAKKLWAVSEQLLGESFPA